MKAHEKFCGLSRAGQRHALACILGDFLRARATPEVIKDWSLKSANEKLIKTGVKVASHGRFIPFQVGRGRHSKSTIWRLSAADLGRAVIARSRVVLEACCCQLYWQDNEGKSV